MAMFDPMYHYDTFARDVARAFRYCYSDQTLNFLLTIRESSDFRKAVSPKGTTFWRAQKGCLVAKGEKEFEDNPTGDLQKSHCLPYEYGRMVPRKYQTCEGRVNPKGIPCLYLANTRETAISEVRPPTGTIVSLALFELVRDVTLVDCSWGFDIDRWDQYKKQCPGAFTGYTTQDQATTYNWLRIDSAFSKPVTNTDDLADYAPTQVLAEEFKRHGFDGIIYRSLADVGKNVALFTIQDASLTTTSLVCVNKVMYDVHELKLNAEGSWP